MPRTRRTAKERAEASVRSLVQKLAKRRAQVAELEAELAEVQAILGAAAGARGAGPRTLVVAPAPVIAQRPVGPTPEEIVAQQEPGIPEGPAGELAGGDNMGEGRWV